MNSMATTTDTAVTSVYIENSNDKKYIELKNTLYELMNNINLEYSRTQNGRKWISNVSTFNPTKIVRLDHETLNELKKKFGDVTTGRKGGDNNDNRYSYKHDVSHLWKLTKKLNEIENDEDGYYVPQGFFYYPPKGACGWHTNSNSQGARIYLTYADEENKSFFRYYDNNKKEIVTRYDKKGWIMNKFSIRSEEEGLFWHCIGSDTNRISIGFRKEKGPCITKDLMSKYEIHFSDISNNIIYQKSSDMFRNFLSGKYHGCIIDVYSNNSENNTKNYVLKLINIHDIFIRQQLQDNIKLKDIYWNNKENVEVGKFHPDINIYFPIILLKSNNNPLKLDYIAIDGNERLSKIASLNIQTITAYVMDTILFYRLIEPDKELNIMANV